MTKEVLESPNFKLSDVIINIYSSTRYMCMVHKPTMHRIGEHVPRNSTFQDHKIDILNRLKEMVEGPSVPKRRKK